MEGWECRRHCWPRAPNRLGPPITTDFGLYLSTINTHILFCLNCFFILTRKLKLNKGVNLSMNYFLSTMILTSPSFSLCFLKPFYPKFPCHCILSLSFPIHLIFYSFPFTFPSVQYISVEFFFYSSE